jgi:hypothetical protein
MVWEAGLFLSLGRPTQEQQKSCLAAAGGFNYDADLRGATRPKSEASDKALMERGFFVNRSRVLIGSGAGTFIQAKSALLSWRYSDGNGRMIYILAVLHAIICLSVVNLIEY